jgi:hypothetical protein
MSSMPWPPPPGARPSIQPPTFGSQGADANGQWYRRQVFFPEPPFPMSDTTAVQPRDRPVESVINLAANNTQPRVIQFDIPTCVYALAASAIDTTDPTTYTGVDPRDLFVLGFENTNGDRFTTAPALASTIVGTAERPRLIGGVGWLFDRGGSLLVNITPLVDNLRIDVNLISIEIRGPANYTR